MATEAGARGGTARLGLRMSGTAVLRRLRNHAVRRLVWGIADQVVSSLTNFAVSIYVVRTLGAVQFGAFSLAYLTYGFALNASRGLSTDPLMVRFSSSGLPTWRRAVAICTGTATVVGLVVGAGVLAVATVLDGSIRPAFLALGLTLPGLLLQDSWRYSFFALGRGSQAFLNDLIWAVVLVPALLVLRMTGHANVFWFVLAWGGSAAVGAAVGPLQARVIPSLSGIWKWLTRHRDLGPRYLAEGLSTSVAGQMRGYGIGLILGLAAVGWVSAAGTLMGPVTVLFMGMSLVTIPEAARILHRAPRHMLPFCLLVSGGLAAGTILWGAVLLAVVPRGLGSWLLGPIWRPTYPLLLPAIVEVVAIGVSVGAGVGLHALGAARRSLRMALLGSGSFVLSSLVGAIGWGAVGTVTGPAITAWIVALLTWRQLRVALRESGKLPAPTGLADPARHQSVPAAPPDGPGSRRSRRDPVASPGSSGGTVGSGGKG